MIKRPLDIAFLVATSMVLLILLAVMFNDWVKCQAMVILGVGSKWGVIKFIGWGIVGILAFWGLVAVNRWAEKQVRIVGGSYGNNNVEKMKVIWKQVRAIRRWIWEKRLSIFLVLVGLLGAVFFIVLILVMFNDCVASWAKRVLNSEYKRDTIKVIGLGIAGVLAIFGAIAVNRRANAQVRDNELVERGHIQERLKTAVGHLGSNSGSSRIASFYEFSHLARDNENLRENIFDILCAHLRQTTADEEYQKKGMPTEEVQSLLDVLFQKGSQEKLIYAEFKSNLRGIFLVMAKLQGADLRRADLQRADLRSADLQNANLSYADLWHADLQNAIFWHADLQSADLQKANLHQTELQCADLRRADLREANLQEADLWNTDLRDADLRGVDLREVKNLETAKLSWAKIENANFPEGYEPPADAIFFGDDDIPF